MAIERFTDKLSKELDELSRDLRALRDKAERVSILEDEAARRLPLKAHWFVDKADYHHSIADDLNEMANDISEALDELPEIVKEHDAVRRRLNATKVRG